MSTTLEPNATAAHPGAPEIRVLYRRGDGGLQLNCSPDRIADAIADVEGVAWIDIEDRESNTAAVEPLLRDLFRFHPLAIEDALKEAHVPRVDDWETYLYIIFHTIDFDPDTDEIRLHEVDVFLGPNYLLTYHTEPIAVLDSHRHKIERDPRRRLRHGADGLLYHLLDQAVAEYLPAIEHLDEAIDAAQDEVFDHPTKETLKSIFRIKRSANRFNRILVPQRELLNRLARDPYDQISTDSRVYFRDVYDHMVRIHEITEGLRDLISGALDTYLSAISNRTNDIMKTLTLVTVMFMPLTFVVGFFGMNFFGGSIEFVTPLPKAFLFTTSCLAMALMPGIIWLWGRHRKWY